MEISTLYLKNTFTLLGLTIVLTINLYLSKEWNHQKGGLKLEISEAILVAVKIAGDNVLGRTAIQKLIYFLSIFGIVEVKYLPHYYGPYSADVASSIQMLSSIDFLKEKIETAETTGYTVPENWKRYLYTLSTEGEQIVRDIKKSNIQKYSDINRIVKICKDSIDFDPEILSWAAKINYILSKKGEPMTYEAIINTADSFGWKLSSEQVDMGVKLLKNLNLCK